MATKDNSWIEDSDILSIFPTCVWKIQSTPEFYEKANTQILKALDELHPDLADIPPGSSWQSNQQLYRREEVIDLVSRILATTKRYRDF